MNLNYKDSIPISIKIKRMLWIIVYYTIFKIFPGRFFKSYRNSILKLFGANIGVGVIVYTSVKIWAPWNMQVGDNSCIGPRVNFYNQGFVSVGCNSIISQDATICASTHEIETTSFNLVLKKIVIGDNVWVASEAFIGPGSCVSNGSVLGARSVLFGTTESWSVYMGNPAKKIKYRNKLIS